MHPKRWIYATMAGILAVTTGLSWGQIGQNGILGQFLIVVGAILFVAGAVGTSREHSRHPHHCPVCGKAIKPVGRWVPGYGFNGTNAMICPHCGAQFHPWELDKNE